MHKVRVFSANLSTLEKVNGSLGQMQDDINRWLQYCKKEFTAFVVHSTDLAATDNTVVYTVYYTFLTDETPKDGPTENNGGPR
jgi:hypothetical protein